MAISEEVLDAVEFLTEFSDLDDRDQTRERILNGLATEVYGPIFGQMVVYGKDHVQAGSFEPHQMAIGLEIAGSLYEQANARYLLQDSPLSGDELAEHHAAVLRGDLALVRETAATSIENAVAQVIEADRAFRNDYRNIGYQAAAGAANYGTIFRDQTMTSGSRITAKLEGQDSPYSLQRASYDGMTHLDSSNLLIGNTVEGIIRHSILVHGSNQKIRLIDIGSGHGATLAAVLHTIKDRLDGAQLPDIAVTAIETTPHFYDELADFVRGPFGASTLGLDTLKCTAETVSTSRFGTLSYIHGNAPRVLQKMSEPGMGNKDETFVIFANYVFHRLPSDKKFEIMQKFAEMENVVFVIGDLVQNTSLINSRHFNLAANGPLNTGNRKMAELFTKAGYVAIDPADQVPCSIDPRLATNIVGDSIDPRKDGHFWVAAKGERALASLSLVSLSPALGPTKHLELTGSTL